MSDRAHRLTTLAAAVSDGAPIDWAAAESSAGTDSERTQIRRLRLIHDLAQSHSGASRGDAVPSVHQSLLHPDRPAVDSPPHDDAEPVTWGPLKVLQKIGRGRFGDVYRAWDPRLDRKVALKLLRQRESFDDGVGSAVIDEGRLLARVRHQHVVTVYGAERIDGRVGVWMELIHGRTLEQELAARGPLPAAEIAVAGIELCRALTAVHRAGLVHRDVKAQNVMRDDEGRLVLMDFGTGSELSESGPPELAGTPLYLAPEVLEGEPASPRSDLYGLGVLLYHLSTGGFPVNGRTVRELREEHARAADRDLRANLPASHGALAGVLLRALAPDPSQRFGSAADMERALESATAPPNSQADTAIAIGRGPRRRLGGVLLLVVTGGLLAAVAWGPWSLRRALNQPSGAQSSVPVRLMTNEPIEITDMTPDGKLAVGLDRATDDSTPDIVIRDLTRGETFRLAGTHKAYGIAPVISDDGTRIAYRQLRYVGGNEVNRPSALVIVGVGPDKEPQVVKAPDSHEVFIPVAWSRDATQLLTLVRHTTGKEAPPISLDWVSLAGKTERRVKLFEPWRAVRDVRVSPDSRFIAFSGIARQGSTERRVYVVEANGGEDVDVVRFAGSSSAPAWTADGRRLLFVSDRSGTTALWSVDVQDGHAIAQPVQIQTPFSGVPVRITRAGTLYYASQANTGGLAQFVAERRPEGTRVIQTFVGRTGTWAPDGRSVAFVRVRPDQNDLIVRRIADGEERPFAHSGIRAAVPRWFHDGQKFLFFVNDWAPPSVGEFVVVDVQTGGFSKKFAKNTADHIRSQVMAISQNDRTAYMSVSGFGADAPWLGIVAVDLQTRDERPVFMFPGGGLPRGGKNPGVALSPDGTTLAIMGWSDPDRLLARIMTVGIDGSGFRDVYGPFPSEGTADLMAWTPDGREILFVTTDKAGIWRTMRIPREGGVATFDGLDSSALVGSIPLPTLNRGEPWTISLSPDGTKLLFDAPTLATYDLWSVALSPANQAPVRRPRRRPRRLRSATALRCVRAPRSRLPQDLPSH